MEDLTKLTNEELLDYLRVMEVVSDEVEEIISRWQAMIEERREERRLSGIETTVTSNIERES